MKIYIREMIKPMTDDSNPISKFRSFFIKLHRLEKVKRTVSLIREITSIQMSNLLVLIQIQQNARFDEKKG